MTTPCSCGSKQPATACCERPGIKDRVTPIDPSLGPVTLPPEMLITENYLDNETCNQLIQYADKQTGFSAKAVYTSTNKSVDTESFEAFIADRIEMDLDKDIYLKCVEICSDVFRKQIRDVSTLDMEWFELPHILRYGKGGLYHPHSDSENLDPQSQKWVKEINRDYSGIVYLNSGFTGGTLIFPSYNLRLHPCAGMLVCFPSDHRFIHQAEEVKSGIRYAMVTWGAAKGSTRVPGSQPNQPVML